MPPCSLKHSLSEQNAFGVLWYAMLSPTTHEEPHILQPPLYFAFIIVPMKGFLLKPYINLSLDDEWETPKEYYDYLCERYNIHPTLDVCATAENRKCATYFTAADNGLNQRWEFDTWCNPPHSMTGDFVHSSNRLVA